MSEKLKKVSVLLKFTSAKGSRIETKWVSDAPGVPKPASPERVLEAVADEIARIAELCGCGDAIEEAVRDARQRVREHFAKATEGQP